MPTNFASEPKDSIKSAARLIPDTWREVQNVLLTGHHEGNRLLLHLLDQVSTKALTTLDLGIQIGSRAEEIDFLAKLEGVALFAMLAERYGLYFGLEKQSNAFVTNANLFDLAEDLGLNVQRADLPYAMELVGMDELMHLSYELPPEILPLDILFTIATRCRDWYEETVGTAMAYAGRHRMVLPADGQEVMKNTLIAAYGTFLEEKEAGVEEALAFDVVRKSLGK